MVITSIPGGNSHMAKRARWDTPATGVSPVDMNVYIELLQRRWEKTGKVPLFVFFPSVSIIMSSSDDLPDIYDRTYTNEPQCTNGDRFEQSCIPFGGLESRSFWGWLGHFEVIFFRIFPLDFLHEFGPF